MTKFESSAHKCQKKRRLQRQLEAQRGSNDTFAKRSVHCGDSTFG